MFVFLSGLVYRTVCLVIHSTEALSQTLEIITLVIRKCRPRVSSSETAFTFTEKRRLIEPLDFQLTVAR